MDEPAALCCSITHCMFRDPVVVVESGNTYERAAILEFWSHHSVPRDPLTNTVLTTQQLCVNWDKRREVAALLDQHPDHLPHGWASRDIPPFSPVVPNERRQAWGACTLCTAVLAIGLAVITTLRPQAAATNTEGSCSTSAYGAMGKRLPHQSGVLRGLFAVGSDSNTDVSSSVTVPKFKVVERAEAMLNLMMHGQLEVSVLSTPQEEAALELAPEAHHEISVPQWIADRRALRLDSPAPDSSSLNNVDTAKSTGFVRPPVARTGRPFMTATGRPDVMLGGGFLCLAAIWTRALWRTPPGADLMASVLASSIVTLPFWYLGGHLVSRGLDPQLHRSTLVVHLGGIQVERVHVLLDRLPTYVVSSVGTWWQLHSCSYMPWDELLADVQKTRSPSCHRSATERERRLQNALRVQTSGWADWLGGWAGSELVISTPWKEQRWLSSPRYPYGSLQAAELHTVREWLLQWAMEHDAGLRVMCRD
jgi:hypothetical protein